ncbi:hypothetical protein Hanom_Chr03g00205001 [Helianthus anomalus]
MMLLDNLLVSSRCFRHRLGCDIESDIPLHTRPPVLVSKVLVHFVSTGMNRILGFVGFIHDNLSQIGPLREPNSV